MKENNKELIKYLDQAFSGVQDQFSEMGDRIDSLDQGLNKKIDDLTEITEKRFIRIESQMVTKSYLDDKLADLSGDLVTKLRKEDAKLDRLVDILRNKSVLDKQDIKQMEEFNIFPKAS